MGTYSWKKKKQEKLKTYGRVSSYKLKSKFVVISRNIVAKLRVKDFQLTS